MTEMKLAVEKSIFPSFDENTIFDEWKSDVKAIVGLHAEKWAEYTPERTSTIEAWNLVLACRRHERVRTNLQLIVEKQNNGDYPTSQAFLEASWNSIRTTVEPLQRDAARQLSADIDALTTYARYTLNDDIPRLIEHFTRLRAKVQKYKTGHSNRDLALRLIEATPEKVQHLLRLVLDEQQHNPDKILEKLLTLAEGAGAKLGLGPTVKEEVANAAEISSRPSQMWQRGKAGVPRRDPTETCGRCGRWHAPGLDNCRAKNQECRKCGRIGHFERKCQSKGQSNEAKTKAAGHRETAHCVEAVDLGGASFLAQGWALM
eukprot:GHVU01008748.1.p1 GENE.GHVU01008748.1~~GHVU01008748.1.p1  ORF type:complete len:317 (-),score=34.62 GHVU01008748.1:658-1608(-)